MHDQDGTASPLMVEKAMSPILKRSMVIAGHKTSVSVEDEFWDSLMEIAGERGMTLAAMIGAIDGGRKHANLSSAIRLFVLSAYCDQIARWGRH
jgi:predicted DNA-binding ribbon-helix-helix protein